MRWLSALVLLVVSCAPNPARFEPRIPNPERRPGITCGEGLEHHPADACVHAAPNFHIVHLEQSGSAFRLINSEFEIDSHPIARFDAPKATLADTFAIPIGRMRLERAPHKLTLTMVFRGHGVGTFSYLRGYRFVVRSSHTFVTGAEPLWLIVTSYAKADPKLPYEERLAIRIFEKGGNRGKATPVPSVDGSAAPPR